MEYIWKANWTLYVRLVVKASSLETVFCSTLFQKSLLNCTFPMPKNQYCHWKWQYFALQQCRVLHHVFIAVHKGTFVKTDLPNQTRGRPLFNCFSFTDIQDLFRVSHISYVNIFYASEVLQLKPDVYIHCKNKFFSLNCTTWENEGTDCAVKHFEKQNWLDRKLHFIYPNFSSLSLCEFFLCGIFSYVGFSFG